MLYNFILGYYYSLTSFNYFPQICTMHVLKKLSKISLPIILFSILDTILRNVFIIKHKSTIILNLLCLFGTFIYYTMWLLPFYIIFNIVLLDKLNNILGNINILKNFNINQDNISNKLYFMLVSCILYILIQLSIYIPYIGNYIQYILIPYSYGYFCLEYVCYYKSIPNNYKIYIIEKNPAFFIGFAINYTILYYIMNPILFLLVFIIMFPLNVIQLYYIDFELITKEESPILSKIFILPIFLSNIILSILDSYLITMSD